MHPPRRHVVACSLAVALISGPAGCAGEAPPIADDEAPTLVTVTDTAIGTLPDGREVGLFTLRHRHGVEVRIIEYGTIVQSILAPDRDGRPGDIVLGFDDLDGYLAGSPYFGATVGRYANRIAAGRFTLDEIAYELATNNGPNHLHGGDVGFDKVLWAGEPIERDGGAGVRFSYESPDGEEGYPGTLVATVEFVLTEDNELRIDYTATTDRPTPINLTHHSYFNLAGTGDVLAHELTINGEAITPIDATGIPTGEISPVAGTPFDFTTPTAIGARIEERDEQLANGAGYDHNFVLARPDEGAAVGSDATLAALIEAATVVDPDSGRVLEVLTTEPGLQFYSGNFLDGALTGKGGQVYGHRSGFCLEPQHFPDSPNQPDFPSTILRPGEQYRSRTILRFGVVQAPGAAG